MALRLVLQSFANKYFFFAFELKWNDPFNSLSLLFYPLLSVSLSIFHYTLSTSVPYSLSLFLFVSFSLELSLFPWSFFSHSNFHCHWILLTFYRLFLPSSPLSLIILFSFSLCNVHCTVVHNFLIFCNLSYFKRNPSPSLSIFISLFNLQFFFLFLRFLYYWKITLCVPNNINHAINRVL